MWVLQVKLLKRNGVSTGGGTLCDAKPSCLYISIMTTTYFTILISTFLILGDKHSIVLYAYLSIRNHKPISPSKILPPLLCFPKYFFLTAVMIMSIYLLGKQRSDIEWILQKFVTDTSCNYVISWAIKGKVARLIR